MGNQMTQFLQKEINQLRSHKHLRELVSSVDTYIQRRLPRCIFFRRTMLDCLERYLRMQPDGSSYEELLESLPKLSDAPPTTQSTRLQRSLKQVLKTELTADTAIRRAEKDPAAAPEAKSACTSRDETKRSVVIGGLAGEAEDHIHAAADSELLWKDILPSTWPPEFPEFMESQIWQGAATKELKGVEFYAKQWLGKEKKMHLRRLEIAKTFVLWAIEESQRWEFGEVLLGVCQAWVQHEQPTLDIFEEFSSRISGAFLNVLEEIMKKQKTYDVIIADANRAENKLSKARARDGKEEGPKTKEAFAVFEKCSQKKQRAENELSMWKRENIPTAIRILTDGSLQYYTAMKEKVFEPLHAYLCSVLDEQEAQENIAEI